MFFKTLFFVTLSTTVLAAYEDERYYRTPPPPRILSHKQTQHHDGGFKFAFAADNGLAQTEAIAPDGSRNGGYTYVDPHGKTITVKYTAGKEGFRILEGEHIPREVQAHHQTQKEQYSQGPQDDGSYKPEKYEDPYNEPEYVKPHRFHQAQQVNQPQQKPTPHYTVKNGNVGGYGFQSPQYFQPQQYQKQPVIPQYKYQLPAQSSRNYEIPHQDEPISNSLETEGKQPVYNDEPGKPYSFGTGYAFHFQN